MDIESTFCHKSIFYGVSNAHWASFGSILSQWRECISSRTNIFQWKHVPHAPPGWSHVQPLNRKLFSEASTCLLNASLTNWRGKKGIVLNCLHCYTVYHWLASKSKKKVKFKCQLNRQRKLQVSWWNLNSIQWILFINLCRIKNTWKISLASVHKIETVEFAAALVTWNSPFW